MMAAQAMASPGSAVPAAGGAVAAPSASLGAAALPQALSGKQDGPPHEIEELMPYRPGLSDYLPHIAAGVVLALIGAALLYVLVKRWRKPKPVSPTDPWELLAQNLAAIAIEPPFARPDQEDVFYRMSLLLREAIELKIGLRATDQTLAELREPLRRSLPLPAEATEELLAFLGRADLVKFAEVTATRAEAEAAKQSVETWVAALRRAVLPLSAGSEALESEKVAEHVPLRALAPSAEEAADGARTSPLPGLPSELLEERGRHAPR